MIVRNLTLLRANRAGCTACTRFALVEDSPSSTRAAVSGRESGTPPEASTTAGVFWIRMGSFGVYNILVGYLLLHRERRGW
jgi:hypothetical protein